MSSGTSVRGPSVCGTSVCGTSVLEPDLIGLTSPTSHGCVADNRDEQQQPAAEGEGEPAGVLSAGGTGLSRAAVNRGHQGCPLPVNREAERCLLACPYRGLQSCPERGIRVGTELTDDEKTDDNSDEDGCNDSDCDEDDDDIEFVVEGVRQSRQTGLVAGESLGGVGDGPVVEADKGGGHGQVPGPHVNLWGDQATDFGFGFGFSLALAEPW